VGGLTVDVRLIHLMQVLDQEQNCLGLIVALSSISRYICDCCCYESSVFLSYGEKARHNSIRWSCYFAATKVPDHTFDLLELGNYWPNPRAVW
jgi:hypothetical protein